MPGRNTLTCSHLFPQKPLEVREGNVKPTNYKVCVLGLWAAEEAEGQRLVEITEALESGRWVKNTSPHSLLRFLMLWCSLIHHQLSCFSALDWHVVTLVAQTLNVWLLLV